MHLSMPSFVFSYFVVQISQVAAHGWVGSVTIDGTEYAGNSPGTSGSASPIRQISSNGPVKGASNADLNCGLDAQLASEVASANSGSTVVFQWTDGTENWVHSTGPLMTYMAVCEDTTCDKYNSTNAGWFKIDQVGLKPGGSTWYQADIAAGDSFSVTLPDNLAPNDYLIRHEIISLQNGNTEGGAEFYPSCTQIRVGGSGTGTPDSTVKFPGAYSDTDPGIYVPDIFNGDLTYIFPGPDISNLAASADSSSSEGQASSGILSNSQTVTASGSTATGGASGTTRTASTSKSTSTAGTGSSSGSGSSSSPSDSSPAPSGIVKCNLKKRDSTLLTERRAERRSHWSRLLRTWAHHS